jgi:hypothetical protein
MTQFLQASVLPLVMLLSILIGAHTSVAGL